MSKRIVRRRRKSTPREVRERMDTACADPDILRMGIVEAMEKYKLNYRNAVKVRERAMSEKINSGKGVDLIRISKQRQFDSLRGRVMRAEKRYTHLHRRLVTEDNMSKIADDFGLSRERVRQLRQQFESFRDALGSTANDTLNEIEEAVVE